MKRLITIIVFLTFLTKAPYSQGRVSAIYPIGDNPNIGFQSSPVPSIEKIIFEANPIVRLPIYNNIAKRLQNPYNKRSSHASTLYFNFRPQFRMYKDNSMPVKMPSYRISVLGFQQVFRSKPSSRHPTVFTFAIESGHYSNGQLKCAFDKGFDDGSLQCDSIYRTITQNTNLTDRLNRESANFSTNFTEVNVNYRIIFKYNSDHQPTKSLSVTGGWEVYHDNLLFLADIGGYTDNDISIYGKSRYNVGIEYIFTFSDAKWFTRKMKADRVTLSTNMEYISKPHKFVKRARWDLTTTLYFQNHIGIFLSGISGHDNYNYRFVDSGTQFFAGITFDIFPPVQIAQD